MCIRGFVGEPLTRPATAPAELRRLAELTRRRREDDQQRRAEAGNVRRIVAAIPTIPI